MRKTNFNEMALPPALRSGPRIKKWSGRYSPYNKHKDSFILKMLQDAVKREDGDGYITLDELLMASDWKNGARHRHLIILNTDESVKDQSHQAFKNQDIRPLNSSRLKGVGIATASAIMHFAFPNKYPIIDSRALKTLGLSSKSLNQKLDQYWEEYQRNCRAWAADFKISLRVLDRALWQYNLEEEDRLAILKHKRI